VSLAASAVELRRVLRATAFARRDRFRLRAVADGRCVLEVPFSPALERPGGIVSGQVLMAAAAAMWLAIMTRLGAHDGSVTSSMTTTFLRAARKQTVVCAARVVKLGRRLIYGVAECADRDGRLVSHHVITYARPEAPLTLVQSRIQDSARGMAGRVRSRSSTSPPAGARRRRPSISARR